VVHIDRRAAIKVSVISIFHNGSLNGEGPPDLPTLSRIFIIMGVALAKIHERNTHVDSEANLHLDATKIKVSTIRMILISFGELICQQVWISPIGLCVQDASCGTCC
jgi:hypothetical protein